MKKIKIGARGSKLSLAYVAKVKDFLLKKNSKLKEDNISTEVIKTSGDVFYNKKVSEIGGKNLFCKEIEESLLSEKIDIAVHSLKDMESVENNNLTIGAFIKRNDPRDAFVSSKYKNLKELKNGAIIGSSSRRRQLQLKLINQKISYLDIRGNVDSRIKKLEEGQLDAIILAAAGLKCLKLERKINFFFSTEEMLPAVGQGVIAVQCRKKDNQIKDILKNISHEETMFCAITEREFLRTVGGDCDTAIGGYATLQNNVIRLKAQLFSDDGNNSFSYEMMGSKNECLEIGQKVGKKILELAGTSFKK